MNNYSMTPILRELAKHPFDLSTDGHLNPDRISHFVSESCGYRLLYGTERVNEKVMEALIKLKSEADLIKKMQAMQSGEIINHIEGFKSEERAVLHTATRDFFDSKQTSLTAKNAALQARKEVDRLKDFCQNIDSKNAFTNLVCIGIGGSDLGPRAHFIALQHLLKPGRQVRFISNIDPDHAVTALVALDLSKTLVLVVSKTGTTLETCANEEFVKSHFIKAGLNPSKHFISVTSAGSPMDDPKKYLNCFHIWDWIGGRYSTTSMVGGVMLSFAFGFDVYWDFLAGAHAMDETALNEEIDTNLPLLGALLSIWNRNFLYHPTLAIIPYSEALARYPAHIQQVEMESNGKHTDQCGNHLGTPTGMIIWGEPGTNAQHSFFQLFHQGTDIVPIEFIGYEESQCGVDHSYHGTTLQQKLLSNLFAQIIALATGKRSTNPNEEFLGNRPSHLLLCKKLTPYSLGSLLAYYEHKIAFEGFIWSINSFDQEGVQLGKILSSQVIKRFNDSKSAPYPLGDAFIQQLKMLKTTP